MTGKKETLYLNVKMTTNKKSKAHRPVFERIIIHVIILEYLDLELNPLQPGAAFLYPLETSENL